MSRGWARKCNCTCSCCKCSCNSIKIHRKAALILMHVRIRISSGVIMEAAAWPQASRTAKTVYVEREREGMEKAFDMIFGTALA